MSSCTATLTTATEVPSVLGASYAGHVVRLADDGNIVAVVTLTTLTCDGVAGHDCTHASSDPDGFQFVDWQDIAPGAKPHGLCRTCVTDMKDMT